MDGHEKPRHHWKIKGSYGIRCPPQSTSAHVKVIDLPQGAASSLKNFHLHGPLVFEERHVFQVNFRSLSPLFHKDTESHQDAIH